MKISVLQLTLAAFVALLAAFWMSTVLLYTVLICTILVCSWLIGLLLYLQFSQGPATVDDLPLVCDNRRSLLHDTVVCLLLLPLFVF